MNEDLLQPILGKSEVENIIGFHTYVCSTCHTAFSSFQPDLTTCIFCGKNSITQGETKYYYDTSSLPFQISLEDAFAIYKKQIRHDYLLPFSFRGKRIMKKIQKVYLPCSLYNLSVEGSIAFYGADTISKVKNAPKQVFECMYSTHFDYLNLLTSDYSRINDVPVSNINDYDFSQLVDFNPEIIKDCCLIASDVEKTEVTEKVQERAIKNCVNIVRGNVGHELKKLSNNHLVVGVSSAKSIFIPIYFINFRYKGQEYLFLVNGQTGNVIVDLPTSKGNLVLLFLVCFILFVLIGCIIACIL
ncbi:MAG: hypothetical protein IKF71_05685 [Bacilli bacterium]|nr:hypothetical protein [Bacilli bacterium]